MKVLKKILLWLIALLYLIPAASFVAARYEKQYCNKIEVKVTDSLTSNFIYSDDIIDLLERKGIQYLGIPLQQINLEAIENLVLTNQIIRSCKTYTSVNGTLHIDITQRQPFLRVIAENGKGFYLDREGNILNLSKRFAPHVLIINGHIKTSASPGKPQNIKNLNEKKMQEIYELAMYITADPLWDSQIQQVYINSKGEYELVPRIGPHLIVLGSINGYREKFDKLEIFYKEGLNKIGWNQYKIINLKYKDQVVCTKI